MPVQYVPITQLELDIIGGLAGFTAPQWTGPALPRPDGVEGLAEIIDTANRLAARAQYLVQAKDGLSIPYTLNNITAPAERFLFGTEEQVEQAADIRGLLVLIETFLSRVFPSPVHANTICSAFEALKTKLNARLAGLSHNIHPADVCSPASPAAAPAAAPMQAAVPKAADYSAFPLEDPTQFSMAWSTFQDAFRNGFPHIAEYVAPLVDPGEATRQFWPTLRSTALPYNLLVLRKLTAASAMSFRTNFGTAWLPAYDSLLEAGSLYGIDMTVFTGIEPQSVSNGTTRFTPSTMVLLEMDAAKNVNPIAVYVADPVNISIAHTYQPDSPAWIYALLAAKTSLTVYGIWLGHVYTLHIVTAAMQMATLNTLPATNVIYQLLAPQSNYTIAFDLLLLLGWSNLSPPTSISDPGKFLTLCNRFSATHDFFSTDPLHTLARLNLDVADFTDPAIDDQPWNLYPNVQMILRIWKMTADYVSAAVDAGYQDDAAVAADASLTAWISAASGQGNVAGLPRMDSKAALAGVVTSILYRITFHGMGRLRSVGSPEPTFAPNYPPCLQSTTIADPGAALPVADLLRTYLPNAGTLGGLVGFYDIFSYNAPYVPVVPYRGAEDELFFDQKAYPGANLALVEFRRQIEDIIRTLQPDWVQIGQWPRNIEL